MKRNIFEKGIFLADFSKHISVIRYLKNSLLERDKDYTQHNGENDDKMLIIVENTPQHNDKSDHMIHINKLKE